MSRILRSFFIFAVLGLLSWGVYAADVPKAVEKAGGAEQPGRSKGPDLSEFKTVDTCQTTRISRTISTTPATPKQPGYLGIQLDKDLNGRLTVRHVDPDSPAARVGLLPGDVVQEIAGKTVADTAALRELLLGKHADDTCKVCILRKDRPVNLDVKLAAISRPLTPQPGGGVGGRGGRILLGVQFGEPDKGGLPVEEVVAGGAAERAGLKAGDILLKVDKIAITDREKVAEALRGKNPGDSVTLLIKRDDKEKELKATLTAGRGGRGGRGGQRDPAAWDTRRRMFTRDQYRLAVIPIEFSDQKHNDKVKTRDWEQALFSKGTYSDRSATGQRVHGSLHDYYWEQSCQHLRVTGKVFDWVLVKNKRDAYGSSSNRSDRTALLTEAVDKLLARDGKETLKDFDGIFFMYAGARPRNVQRGGLFWPHKAQFSHNSKRWDYFISNEGGERMSDISVICHEFGHMLGLPDLYARPETPGMEGVGVWCAMSNQLSGGRPQHFSAWSKEQLGWVKPAVIDPTVRQKLVLSPIFGSKKECFKVLLHPDGSEYLLLENRTKKGFDTGLPGEGLLIWRIAGNRVLVEESHGITGPTGPRSYPNSVPFPSKSNNAFTPYTTPSSKSLQGGGLPVHITNITRLPDGRITFFIGYEYF